jgi:hypothetical protein
MSLRTLFGISAQTYLSVMPPSITSLDAGELTALVAGELGAIVRVTFVAGQHPIEGLISGLIRILADIDPQVLDLLCGEHPFP